MFFVQIAGHLGSDPVTRVTPTGQKVTSFSVATKQRKGKDKEDITIWVRITIWGDKFDRLLPHLKKGGGVIVNGKMAPPSNYTDKEGRQQFSLEVTAEMIEFSPFGRTDRPEGEQQRQPGAPASSGYSSAGPAYASNSAHSHGAAAPTHDSQHNHEMTDEESLPF